METRPWEHPSLVGKTLGERQPAAIVRPMSPRTPPFAHSPRSPRRSPSSTRYNAGQCRRPRATTTRLLRGTGHAAQRQRDGDPQRVDEFLLDPLNATSLVTNAKRVLYKTTNRSGKAIAVSGTAMVPTRPWIGIGTRPVIGYAPGTQGMADAAPRPGSSPRASSTRGSGSGPAHARLRRRDDRLRGPRHRRHPHLHGSRLPGPRHPRRHTRRPAPSGTGLSSTSPAG